MADYIEYGDNGKVAREKINNIVDEVNANIPSIGENGDWYLGPTDTGTPATGPQGEQGPQGPEGPQGPIGDDGTDVLSEKEYEDKPGTSSDDIVYFIWA